MAKFRVWGTVTVSVYIDVEAEDKEGAKDAAYDEFGGLSNFVGNGGHDKLIGVYNNNESIEADGEVEWKEVEEV